ncbi:unnamed protein product [Rotaria magnacalcarata]|uniref:Uncharacterized protein n=1 Tax=Rotaria magnacalcarata TaxID=392030 RepID=A0A816TY10_9BILA|nr:unnamed protein product [Rotaria magnacalcarata]CAF3761358.1 unnamed protein product [Rotaria magnacalcarata]
MYSNQDSQPTKYIEIAPNGQVVRQAATVPPDVAMNYLALQGTATYNNTSSNSQWPTYASQSSSKQRWWQSSGPYNPYRTTYQDYGPSKNKSYSISNRYYAQPYTYGQISNVNGGSKNLYEITSYPTTTSMPSNSPRPLQYIYI